MRAAKVGKNRCIHYSMNSLVSLTPDFAELLGIIVGDGYVRTNPPRWLSIECAAYEKRFIDTNVIPLVTSVFGRSVKGKFYNRHGKANTYGICVCSKQIIEILAAYDVAIKHDIIDVPSCVMESSDEEIKLRFLRGFIDTDGCLSFIKKKELYSYPRLNVSSVSPLLMKNVVLLFQYLGFRGSFWRMKTGKKSKLPLYRFEIKGAEMIRQWWKIIGSKNPSIISKYLLWKRYGECKTNSSFEERVQILKNGNLNIAKPS